MATKLKILVFSVLFLLTSILSAQEPDIVSFEERADFPVSHINHIKQDLFGYLWIASAQGLYRFDGTRFVRLVSDVGLKTKNIVALYADADSSIWASAIDGETWNIRRNRILGHYTIPDEYPHKRAPIKATYRKINDTLVFENYGEYTVKLTSDSDTHVFSSETSDLIAGLMNRVDTCWHEQFVYYLELNLDTLRLDPRFKSGHITVVNGVDNACVYYGNLLIRATPDSIGARFTPHHLVDQKHVNGTTFKSIYGKGLVVRRETGATDTLLNHFYVTCIFIDDHNGVWIGTQAHGMFYIRNFLVRNYPLRYGSASAKYNDIAAFGDTLLMLTNQQLFMLNNQADKPEQLLTLPFFANRLFVLPNQQLVVMGMRQIELLSKTNGKWGAKASLSNNDDVNYDGVYYQGHFFTIGLMGIYKHDFHSGQTTPYALGTKRIRFLAVTNNRMYAADNDSLWTFANNEIVDRIPFFGNSYLKGDGNYLIAASEGKAISVLRNLTDTVIQVDNEERVRDVFVLNNELFVSSYNGVVVHSMDSQSDSEERFFDISMGLRSSNVRKTLCVDGELVFLLDAGVAVSPDTLFRAYPEYTLDINTSGEIKKNGHRIRIEIGKKTNHLQIKFSTFHFDRLFRAELYYCIQDDSVWYPMTNNEMSLVNLKGGKTDIEVAFGHFLTNEPEHYHLVIHKKLRWDEKMWVQIVLFVLIVTLLSLVMHSRVRRIQRKSELNTNQISQLQTVLRQQMNPHFIFNSLTSINHYILQNKRIEASRFLTKFSTLIRNILDYSGGNNIMLTEEIDVIDGYLALEALRFKGRFSYNIHVDSSVDKSKVLIPPFIIYPFVERALREGVIHRGNKGSIIVRFRMSGGYVQCAVVDDGVGLGYFKKNVNKLNDSINKNGTQIAKQRIEIYNTLHKEKILLHVEDIKNAVDEVVGTHVLLDFPLKKA